MNGYISTGMKSVVFSIVCVLVLTFVFSSCASEKSAVVTAEGPEPEPVPHEQTPTEEPMPSSHQQAQEPFEEESTLESLAHTEEQVPEEAPPSTVPQPVNDTFEVTKEVYNQAFDEISKLIDELNTIIRNNEFDKWQRHLTDDYKRKYSNSRVLNELSQQPILKKYNIKLKTLRDYFMYVVVQSRSNAKLDDIEFIDDSHVNALMAINQRKVILYQIQKTPDGWKIGEW